MIRKTPHIENARVTGKNAPELRGQNGDSGITYRASSMFMRLFACLSWSNGFIVRRSTMLKTRTGTAFSRVFSGDGRDLRADRRVLGVVRGVNAGGKA